MASGSQLTDEQFGGDPKHVTLGGGSAGAASINLHLTAYGGRDDNLFHATAAESPSFGVQFTVKESQYQYDGLVERAGCKSASDTLACLRDLSEGDLQTINFNIPTPGGTDALPLFMYSNVVDGDITTDFTYNLFGQGKFIKVPVIFGYVFFLTISSSPTDESVVMTRTAVQSSPRCLPTPIQR